MDDLYEYSGSLPVNPDEYDSKDIAIADEIADDWRAEHDPTPLTLEHCSKSDGWFPLSQRALQRTIGNSVVVVMRRLDEKTYLLTIDHETTVVEPTLGDLRTLTRILTR